MLTLPAPSRHGSCGACGGLSSNGTAIRNQTAQFFEFKASFTGLNFTAREGLAKN